MSYRHKQTGFSLIEMLLVISVMAILAGLVIPNSNPTIHDQLQATAQIMAADLAYARSLAVTHASRYQVEFDTSENRYVITHSGANPSLDELPDSPYRNPDDLPEEHAVDLDSLPHMGPTVEIAAAAEIGSTPEMVDTVEFGPLGETTAGGYTVVWLAAGTDSSKRYIMLYINPVTGLTTIGTFSATGPPQTLVESEIIPAEESPI